MDYLKLLGGLVLLVLCGDYLVKGGVAIATRLKITPLVIGMTIVAFGTSAPEFLVSLQAAIKGVPEIAIGNVVGSNIANIALILGITAVISPLMVTRNSIRIDWPAMMIATLLFTLAASGGKIMRWQGITGFAVLIAFIIFQIYYSRKNHIPGTEKEEEKPIGFALAAIYIIGSCVGLSFGASLLIEGASSIAASLGISQRVIGVTIVAFGTSLPELAASIAAAMKKQADIAIGNIIGSNLFNILCVIGLSSAITPITVNWQSFRPDFIWMTVIAFALIFFIFPLKKALTAPDLSFSNRISLLFDSGKFGRIGGICMLISYIYYIYLLF